MTDNDLTRISLYLDDELTTEQRQEFERDLQANPELQSELNIYKRFSNQLIITKEDQQASKRIKAAVLQKQRQLVWRKRLALFMPMAAVVFVLAVISFSLRPQKSITADDIFDEYSIALTEISQ